ncbi:LysR family transcriptional regulator [Rhizobium sp. PP-F2F-G48]|nr:LysR family transcriptional regulator [Rhizobium sp. PP-F2F-G48]
MSAISHAVRGLEESLGFRLLDRTTRSVAPTEAGRRLLEGLAPALASISDAIEGAGETGHQITGTIRLSVPRSAAELVLLPLVLAFTKRHTGAAVDMRVEDGLTDIVAGSFDAGVRFGESLEQDMIAVPIGPRQRTAIVGSPAYFETHPTPATPHDLADHVGIRRRFAGGALYDWEFERDGFAMTVAMQGPITLNDDGLIVEAALAGAGLVYAFEGQVLDSIKAGTLVRVLEDWCEPFSGFYLYYPSRRLMRPVMRAFIDCVRSSPQ